MSDLFKKVFRRNSRAPEKDLEYLQVGFNFGQYPYLRPNTSGFADNNDDGDDRASISTVSTNATADNLPGPGRIIDVCIYQFLGRKIERFANRFSMSRLPPARIVQCLGVRIPSLKAFYISDSHSDIINDIYEYPHHPGGGGVMVAGLTSLVRQTK